MKEVSSAAEHRLLTQLQSGNSAALTADLVERDVDGYGRSFFLCGIDVADGADIFSQNTLTSWLQNFDLYGSAPIHLVLLQPGDAKDFVFVPSAPSSLARHALTSLGVNELAPEQTRKYNKLRGVELKSVISKIISLAFGNTDIAGTRSSGKR